MVRHLDSLTILARSAIGVVLAILILEDPARAQGGAAGALQQVFVGEDPRAAVLSAAQLDILQQAITVDVNSLPTPGSQFRLGGPAVSLEQSAAPIYLERAALLEGGDLDVFAVFQHASFTRLDDIDLEGGDLVNRVPAFFGRPAVESRASMSVSSDTTAIGVNYGIRTLVDLGITVPMQHVCVQGLRAARFDTGEERSVAGDGCSTGIGDVQLRAKMATKSKNEIAFGVQALVSLATGAPSQLTGKGQTQVTLTGLASRTTRTLQPHVNFGVTLGGDGVTFSTVSLFGSPSVIISSVSPSSSVNYGAGTSILLSERLWLNVEYVGRHLRNGARFEVVETLGGASLETVPVDWQPLGILSAGGAVNVGRDFIVSGHVSRQVVSAGLQVSWLTGISVTMRPTAIRGKKS